MYLFVEEILGLQRHVPLRAKIDDDFLSPQRHRSVTPNVTPAKCYAMGKHHRGQSSQWGECQLSPAMLRDRESPSLVWRSFWAVRRLSESRFLFLHNSTRYLVDSFMRIVECRPGCVGCACSLPRPSRVWVENVVHCGYCSTRRHLCGLRSSHQAAQDSKGRQKTTVNYLAFSLPAVTTYEPSLTLLR
jgi:hypothetical protein